MPFSRLSGAGQIHRYTHRYTHTGAAFFRATPRYASDSRSVCPVSGLSTSLIMPGSRVRVPPLLLDKARSHRLPRFSLLGASDGAPASAPISLDSCRALPRSAPTDRACRIAGRSGQRRSSATTLGAPLTREWFAILVRFAPAWPTRYRQGPLEWLLRFLELRPGCSHCLSRYAEAGGLTDGVQ
jgi:hypothetical protein